MPPSAKQNQIPSSVDIQDEIDRHVNDPMDQLAEETAAWCVEFYRQEIKKNARGTKGLILKCRANLSFEVHFKIENLLIRKGWFYNHNFVNNTFYMSPCAPREPFVMSLFF